MSDDDLLSRLLRGGFREQKTRLRIDWMTHTDDQIMEHLASEGPATPETIATTLEKSAEYVADRCRQLVLRELLASENGQYRLSDRGQAYLDGEIGVDELDDGNDET